MGIQIIQEDDFWSTFEITENLQVDEVDINKRSVQTQIAKERTSIKKRS